VSLYKHRHRRSRSKGIRQAPEPGLRPWGEVARRFNEANGTNISANNVSAIHNRAMKKFRKALMEMEAA
jgi:hypothetical protein